MNLEQLASDMGDLLCVTAMAMVVGFWCWTEVDRLAAVAFGLTYVTAFLVTSGLKIVSADIGLPLDEASIFQLSQGAPSGHVALSVVVYGSAIYLCSRAVKSWEAMLCQTACLLVLVCVAVTRVTLHTHTIPDVVAGVGVGALVTLLPVMMIWSRPHVRGGSARGLLAGMIVMGCFMLVSGLRLPSGHFNLA